MYDFMRDKLHQHIEVTPNITLYLFEHRYLIVEVTPVKYNMEANYKVITQMDNTVK